MQPKLKRFMHLPSLLIIDEGKIDAVRRQETNRDPQFIKGDKHTPFCLCNIKEHARRPCTSHFMKYARFSFMIQTHSKNSSTYSEEETTIP